MQWRERVKNLVETSYEDEDAQMLEDPGGAMDVRENESTL